MKNHTHQAPYLTVILFVTALNYGTANADVLYAPKVLEVRTDVTATDSTLEIPAPEAESTSLTAPVVTDLPDRLNVIADTLAKDQEFKYYSFTAARGQRVMLNQLNNPGWGPNWKYEYRTDDNWITAHPPTPLITSDLEPGQKVEIRISKHPEHPRSFDGAFQFEFGSAPYLVQHKVKGDVTELQIHLATTEVITNVSWSGQVNDSKGHPVEGATMILEINKNQKLGSQMTIFREITPITGSFSSQLNIGTCRGTLTSPVYPARYGRNKYVASYNFGYWSCTREEMSAPGLETKRALGFHLPIYAHNQEFEKF